MSQEYIQNMTEENIQQNAASIFTRVRDIPYVLGTQNNCTNKHFYLLPKLKQLGYKIEIGIAQFNWQDLSPIPKEITALLKDPIDVHLFLYAKRNSAEMIVDASWDPGMPDGFQINSWDGCNQTVIGVPALSIHRVSYHLLSARVSLGRLLRKMLTDQPKPTPFNDAFNAWLGRANLSQPK